MIIAQVNCDENSELANRVGIEGYPTIMIYNESKQGIEYEGSRDYQAMVDYINRLALGSSSKASLSKDYGTDPYMDKYVKEFFAYPNDREKVFEQIGGRARAQKDL